MRFVVWTLVVMVFVARTVAAEETPLLHDRVKFTQLSPNVWMHTSYTHLPKYGRFPANGLVVVEGDTAVLIDSGWTDADAIAVIDWASQHLDVEIDRAVFTHSHADKMGGVGAIHARGITTHALELTNQYAIEQGLEPAHNRLFLTEEGETFQLGPVELYFPGPGHSADNIVANIASAGIIFGGCLVRPPNSKSLGNTDNANLDNWDKAVQAVASAFPASHIVVPTHGPPAGQELLGMTVRLVRNSAPE